MHHNIEKDLDKSLNKIKEKCSNQSNKIMFWLSKGETFYRLQNDYYGGKGIFFNPDGSNSRYGVNNGRGTLYVAEKPRTALGETFKGLSALREERLDDYHMATLKTEKDLKIVDGSLLMTQLKMTVHDLTATSYKNTQKIANFLCQFYDGLKYISNRTGEICVVLWHEDPDGKGIISLDALVPLSAFYYNGESATDIIIDDIGIPII